jgi:ubiquinone/menaquinone biosynthesis C-methylase UbiE
MLHHVTSLILGGALHVAELPKEMYRVLDVGTGTGIWAVDFAEYFRPFSQGDRSRG